VEFVDENPEIGIVRTSADGIHIFIRSVGREGEPFPHDEDKSTLDCRFTGYRETISPAG
jgi:hypothetical protein